MLKGDSGKIAVIYKDVRITYSQLESKVSAYSSLFGGLSGKRAAIFSENRLEWIYAFYAIWNTGNIPVPIDYLSGADDVSFILGDSMPSIVFCSEEKLPVIKSAISTLAYQPKVLVFEKIEVVETEISSVAIDAPDNKTAVIIYTSGTTGSPKGVMLSFDNIRANIEAVTTRVKIYNENDRTLILLPLHHILPLLGTMAIPLSIGGSAAICPSLNADDIIRTLQKNQVSVIVGVPRLYSLIRKGVVDKINQSKAARALFALAKKIQSPRFSRIIFKTVHQKFGGAVKYLVSGGAALDPEVGRDFKTLGFDVLEGYGMTEAAPMITFTRPGRFVAGSPGQPVPGVKVEIRDGEIVASGRNIMQGYYNREAETADILKDGWLYTGDLGYLDKHNNLFITGRKKEIIVLSNGKKINPAEIEQKLETSFEGIKESGVFIYNDKLSALIVPDFAKLHAQGIDNIEEFIRNEIKHYNSQASSSKRILKHFIFKEDLPKTRLGKLQRFKLQEISEQSPQPEKEREQISEEFNELKTLMGFLEEQTGVAVYPDDLLENDLALDSLSKITLLVYIENTFGVTIEEQQLGTFRTILDLGRYIRDKKTRLTPDIINWANILKEKVNIHLPKTGFSFNIFNWSYRAIFKSLFRLRAEGVSNIPDGPCIIAANHQSFLDGFVVASLIRRTVMRKTYFYAKEKHWRHRWQKFLAKKNNIILMDVNKDLKLSLQKMAAILTRGKNLIIFPEGTRSSNGQLGEFKKTFAILAHEMNVPVVPVVISGSHRAMPVGSWFPRLFRKVSVKFLQPVYPVNHTYDSLKQHVENVVASNLFQKD
ncbi:MAG: AMP-binding protein [Bacteroidales bacterium]|nr:AMP-binding protein [Bacteroidales bacterium]